MYSREIYDIISTVGRLANTLQKSRQIRYLGIFFNAGQKKEYCSETDKLYGFRKDRDKILAIVEGGNNGGDAAAAARILKTKSIMVPGNQHGKMGIEERRSNHATECVHTGVQSQNRHRGA